MSRAAILAKPAWAYLASHPELARLELATLRALDSFFDHLIEREIGAPSAADFRAWASLGAGSDGLARLYRGMELLDPSDPSIHLVQSVLRETRCKAGFRGASRKGRDSYARIVSVAPEELPAEWQRLLSHLALARIGGEPGAPAPDILARMQQKLCQYIHVVRRAGLQEDLHLEGLQAFHASLAARSNLHTGTPLRPATLRATWEELERFARLAGWYPAELHAALKKTLRTLREREAGVVQLKYAKAHGLGGPVAIIRDALDLLESASQEREPWQRHMRRNRAAALALPAILPLRRDWHRIVFGMTLCWREGRYRFENFKLAKTALLGGRRKFPGSVHPKLARFVDALVLQDNDPSYLDELRQHVERNGRPLFVNPDGASCARSYVSRIWSERHGTGATNARTLVHDHFGGQGEVGVQKGMILCDQYSRETAEHYNKLSVAQQQLAAAQDDLLDELSELD